MTGPGKRDGEGGSYAWWLVVFLWVVALLNYIDRQTIYSIFPLLKSDLTLSDSQLGLVSSVFLWTYGTCSLFTGYLADRFGRKRMVIASLFVWSGVTALTATSHGVVSLCIARGLMGVSEACYLPAALALIVQAHRTDRRSLATGLHYTGIYLGAVIGGAGGGYFGERVGWRVTFAALGLAGVCYAAVLPKLLKSDLQEPNYRRRSRTAPASSVVLPRRLAPILGLAVAFCAVSIVVWVSATWLPTFFHSQFRYSLAKSGFVASFWIQGSSAAGIALGGPLSDWLAVRTPEARTWVQVMGLIGGGSLLAIAGRSESATIVITGLVAFGFAKGLFDCNVMPVLCDLVDRKRISSVFGVVNAAGTIVGGTFAWLAGAYLKNLGFGLILELTGGVSVIAGVIYFASRSGRRSITGSARTTPIRQPAESGRSQ